MSTMKRGKMWVIFENFEFQPNFDEILRCCFKLQPAKAFSESFSTASALIYAQVKEKNLPQLGLACSKVFREFVQKRPNTDFLLIFSSLVQKIPQLFLYEDFEIRNLVKLDGFFFREVYDFLTKMAKTNQFLYGKEFQDKRIDERAAKFLEDLLFVAEKKSVTIDLQQVPKDKKRKKKQELLLVTKKKRQLEKFSRERE